ncbi:MAG TPA: hypothetical protein VMT62_06070 [Syntrophorhabdaceae bacterium]|nr:hypothetical protein [Syntrophorhabdaceae bacterium]
MRRFTLGSFELILGVSFLLFLSFWPFSGGPCLAHSGNWAGVDESVVEKFAKEQGHEARAPFINTEGDLLPFLFLLAGAVGGFAAGYYWRALFDQKGKGSTLKTGGAP